MIVTREWLWENYGSKRPGQVFETRDWLLRYGTNVPTHKLDEWAQWKHVAEYQVNNVLIVEKLLALIGQEVETELEAHRLINSWRVPVASAAYQTALDVTQPKSILELGTGGDSAISTAIFLRHCEKVRGNVLSIDRNPLGVTNDRYHNVPFWRFEQRDSVDKLNALSKTGTRIHMIFIDTIHSYPHTLCELDVASKLTDVILMDDIDFPGNNFDPAPGGVKRACAEWMSSHPDWKRHDFPGANVGVIYKGDYQW